MQLERVFLLIACAVAGCHDGGAPVAPAPAAPAASATPAEPAGHHPGHSWDEIYRRGQGFKLTPNQLLTDSVRSVKPGKALDIGMGQGRNAVFLAKQGWDVTGVDTSVEGVRIAGENAKAAGVEVHGVVQDIATFDLGTNRYDLIAMIYMDDRKLMERIRNALVPGGMVVVEFFHSDANHDLPHPIDGFHTGELDALFPGYTIVRSEVVEDIADFGERPTKLVRFVAKKPA